MKRNIARILSCVMLTALLAQMACLSAFADEAGEQPGATPNAAFSSPPGIEDSTLAPFASYAIDISGSAADGPGYTWDATTKVMSFTAAANTNTYTLTQTGDQNVTGIVVTSGVDAAISLKDIDLETTLSCIKLEGNARLTLTLEGQSSLQSSEGAGIEVTENASLIIQGDGALEARGGTSYFGAAGIGGGGGGTNGTVTIKNGTVAASGAYSAAGIGGGAEGGGGTITIEGGTVTAIGSGAGAGLGGGAVGATGTITISGGAVTALGGPDVEFDDNARGGQGIGGTTGTITISGGAVTAIGGTDDPGIGGPASEGGMYIADNIITISDGTVTAVGGRGAAGIGGGAGAAGGTITISGGTVEATGGSRGAGIGGGGWAGAGGTITINGGTVEATGGEEASGIGSGAGDEGLNGDGGIITISSGTVTAFGNAAGAGIGGGYNCTSGAITINGGTVTAIGVYGTGIGSGAGKTGDPSTSVFFAPAAKVYAFTKYSGIPAIDAPGGTGGTGNYVIANLPSEPYERTLALYVTGISRPVSELTLPAEYSSFAFTTGTALPRTYRIYVYQASDAAYLGRAGRVDASFDITPTRDAIPTSLVINSDPALAPAYGPATVIQHEGFDRQDTAARASAKAYPDPSQVDTVILAYAHNFPDALAASYLAGALNAPILLSDTSEIPATTAAELSRLRPRTVYIVGGTGSISADVERALATYDSVSSVTRLGGAGRAETAYLIAREAAAQSGVPEAAFVVNAGDFPDALSSGSLSAWQGVPILLTDTGTLDMWAQRFLDENGIKDIIIVGGTGSVSDGVAAQLGELSSNPSVARWSGSDRYATSADVLDKATVKWNLSPSVVGLASGEDFPDALVGGAAVGSRGGLMAITNPDVLSPGAATAISTHKDSHGDAAIDVEIFGGPGTIRVADQAQALLA